MDFWRGVEEELNEDDFGFGFEHGTSSRPVWWYIETDQSWW